MTCLAELRLINQYFTANMLKRLVPLKSVALMGHDINSNFALQEGEPVTITNTNTRNKET